MVELLQRLAEAVTAGGRDWLVAAEARARAEGERALAELFPALARRIGRTGLAGSLERSGDCIVDLAAWRACDAAGLLLIRAAKAGDDAILDLYRHGDYEERTIVLRSLAPLPVTRATIDLLGEVQRSNVQVHFEAGVCDSNLLTRAVGHHGFDADRAWRVLLKGVFLDLPLDRFFGILDHASQELSRLVTSLASEREAAGRPVWADTNRVVARAPIDDSRQRLLRGLGHEDERTRLATAQALLDWRDPALLSAARPRLATEVSSRVRAALERALSVSGAD